MEILENNNIINLKTNLLEKIKIDRTYYGKIIDENRNNATNWKFATDEMFTPVPFYHELNKFKKGRLLKLETNKLNIVDEALKKKNFAFGFSESGKLLITMWSYNNYCTVYNHTDDSIEYFTMEYFPDKPSKNKLVSVSTLTNIQNNLQFYVCVSSNRINWSANIYEYENNRVNKVYRYSEGWGTQAEYRFEYENDDLKKITALMIYDIWKKEE
jgi:hypothetical protein